MSGYFATRAARRRGLAYGLLLGASVIMMLVSSSPIVRELQSGIGFAFRPLEAALDSFGRDVSSVVSALVEMDELRTRNETLEQENARLESENRQAKEMQRQNELLTALLQLRSGFEHETVAAAVIGRESNEFRRVVTLGVGAVDGVELGDIVVASGAAVAGRVVEVGANYSRVLLISDTGSTVIGQLTTSAATGEVVGQLGGLLVMGKIDSSIDVVLGEEVVTAGIELNGGIRSPFPKGLVIGIVVDATRDANEVVQTAYLEPAIDLERLEYVLVILDYEGGLPPPDEQPTSCDPTDDGTLPDSEQPCVTPTPAVLPTPGVRP
ncbi:MAG: rod shape-determining protein MreC [Chloroflexi bacterium]|nr:rod shape-determining protein MreC [Chloroflexota bacterium]